MRWEQLFSDLDDRFEDLADAAMMAELADRQRVAAGAVAMNERIGGAAGRTLRARTTSGVTVTGTLTRVGPDWALLAESPGREVLVSLAAVTVVEGLSSVTGPTIRGVSLRLDLRYMLRGIARDRSPVAVVVPGSSGGMEGTGTELTGTIDRVGADFVELAEHAPWEPRRASSVRSIVLIPLASIVLVRSVAMS